MPGVTWQQKQQSLSMKAAGAEATSCNSSGFHGLLKHVEIPWFHFL